MKYDKLVSLVSQLPWFDLATLVQLTNEERKIITGQLHRWILSEKVIPLRRGMYTLAERYRGKALSPPALANALYAPSYLTAIWALGFYGLIPEKVATHTSVTTRVPRKFANRYGTFRYFNIKQDYFFGYEPRVIDGHRLMIATPEKALVDHWHLNTGEWNFERLSEMRYQQFDLLDINRLKGVIDRLESPRLVRAMKTFLQLKLEENEGIEL